MRGCSSYPTHSEGQRLLRFLCRSSPHSDRHSPRSRHESLPSHDVPGASFPTVWVVADAFRIVAPKPGSRPEAGQCGADILAGRRKRPAVRAGRENYRFLLPSSRRKRSAILRGSDSFRMSVYSTRSSLPMARTVRRRPSRGVLNSAIGRFVSVGLGVSRISQKWRQDELCSPTARCQDRNGTRRIRRPPK
jgi:hypothetical protein